MFYGSPQSLQPHIRSQQLPSRHFPVYYSLKFYNLTLNVGSAHGRPLGGTYKISMCVCVICVTCIMWIPGWHIRLEDIWKNTSM
jgi:hypothetical protein